MDSAIFPGYRYELDEEAPVVTTRDEAYDLDDHYNQTVGIERVNGIMMLIEHRSKKQVAKLHGEFGDWVQKNYPSDAQLADHEKRDHAMRNAEYYLQHGKFPEELVQRESGPVASYRLADRRVCGDCPLFVQSCKLNPGKKCKRQPCTGLMCVI